MATYMYRGTVCSELDAIKDFVNDTLNNLKSRLNDNDTIFDLTKLNVSQHACAYNNDMFDGYIFCENKMSPTYKEFVKESETNIDHPYKYVHAAFFMGPSDIVYKMCNDKLLS